MTRHTSAIALAAALALLVGCHWNGAAPSPGVPAAAAAIPQIPIPNARMLGDDVLTGGQPTAEQLEQAAAAGYRTVVNLRTPGEEGAWDEAPLADEMGLRYVAIPVAGGEGLTLENVRQLAAVVDDPQAHPARRRRQRTPGSTGLTSPRGRRLLLYSVGGRISSSFERTRQRR